MVGDLACQNISKKDAVSWCFFYINAGSVCIFTTNKEQSLDERNEIVKDQLSQTTNSYISSLKKHQRNSSIPPWLKPIKRTISKE